LTADGTDTADFQIPDLRHLRDLRFDYLRHWAFWSPEAGRRFLPALPLLSPATMLPDWDSGHWDEGFWDEPSPVFQPLPSKPKKTNHRTMASNPTPDDDDVLFALAEDLADGCHLHEVTIGIKQNTEAVLRATLGAATGAVASEGALNTLLETKETAQTAAEAASAEVLRNCRLRLLKVLGSEPNASWEEAGFFVGTTAIPRDEDQRFTLLGKLKTYFTNHPAAESVDTEATAAICTTAYGTLSDARSAANATQSNLTTAEGATKTAIRTLRKRVRGLIEELGTLLADDDPRYEAFGLNVPANPAVPEGIEELTLTALGNGRVHVQWSYATRMTGARVMRKLPGPDEVFASAGTSAGLEKVLTAQPVGALLEIRVVPYNDGGDGSASPVKSITVT